MSDEKRNVGNTIRHSIPRGYYTRMQAAERCGRSVETLRSWQHKGIFVPTHYVQMGQLQVNLYTKDDIKELRKIAATIKRGRPRKV